MPPPVAAPINARPQMPKKKPVPLEAVAKFVRQLSHDVRNELAVLDLQAGLLTPHVAAGDGAARLAELRRQITVTAANLRTLASRFTDSTPQPASWTARTLFEYCRDAASILGKEAADLAWTPELAEEKVTADIELFAAAWAELLRNALHFREPDAPLTVRAAAVDGHIVFALHESKAAEPDFSAWGAAPFQTMRRGGYGLGLYCAQQAFAAQGAELSRSYDAKTSTLITTVALPALVARQHFLEE